MKRIISTLIILCIALVSFADVEYISLKGKLGDAISFKLDVQESTFGTLIGRTTYYRKNGKVSVIKCYGYLVEYESGETGYILNEYVGTKECGTFFFQFGEDGLKNGTWSHLDKSYEMNDIEMLEPDYSEMFYSPSSTLEDAIGEYVFTYESGNPYNPEYGGNCVLKRGGNDKIVWSMAQVTPNIAEASGVSEFNGGYFTGSFNEFKFEAYVDKEFIYVKQTNTERIEMDDWGVAATIAGIYIRKK